MEENKVTEIAYKNGYKKGVEDFFVEMKASTTLSTLLDAGWETFYKMVCNDMYDIAKDLGVEIKE